MAACDALVLGEETCSYHTTQKFCLVRAMSQRNWPALLESRDELGCPLVLGYLLYKSKDICVKIPSLGLYQ